MRNIFKVPNEKGAVIVFLAITLPLLLVLVGGAIDFGNAYIHKSRLQNTADAAVLAGAREFAVHGENDSIHPYADAEAERYVEHNAETANGSLPSIIKGKRYQAKQVDNSVIYYRVLLTEEVPFYFLRILGDNFKSLDIQADAVAAISATSGSGEDVFIFSRNFSLVNTISNPDNFDMNGQILTCFDSSVAFTDRNDPYNNLHHLSPYVDRGEGLGYSDQAPKLRSFFTSKAKGMSVNAARAKDGVTQEKLDEIWDAQVNETSNKSTIDGIRYDKEKYVHTAQYISYDMNDILRQTTGQLNIGLQLPTKPEDPKVYPPQEVYGIEEWKYQYPWNATEEQKAKIDAARKEAEDEYAVRLAEYNEKLAAYNAIQDAYKQAMDAYKAEMSKYNTTQEEFHAADLRKGNLAIAPGANYARTINIDGSLGSENDSPLYLYIDENCSPVHINVTASNNRPIVLCYAGRSQLDFNMSAGVTFRGILYVPNSNNAMDVLIHDSEGARFEGSIIANSLALHGAKATYEYVNFGVTGSGYVGGGTGSGRVSASSSVKLVPSSQIDWD